MREEEDPRQTPAVASSAALRPPGDAHALRPPGADAVLHAVPDLPSSPCRESCCTVTTTHPSTAAAEARPSEVELVVHGLDGAPLRSPSPHSRNGSRPGRSPRGAPPVAPPGRRLVPLDLDVIDVSWMDNNVHAMRHNFFGINRWMVDDLREIFTTHKRARLRTARMTHRFHNVWSFLAAPRHVVNP